MNDAEIEAAIAAATGARPVGSEPLGGGCVSDVRRVRLSDGGTVVVKVSVQGGLAIEASMLAYLAERSNLPVPAVLHTNDNLVVMTDIATRGGITSSAQTHAGALLADLHDITADRFGFDHGTVIGGLPQPNPWTENWLAFFRDHRLLAMARSAHDAGRLPAAAMKRVENLAGRLDRWIEAPGSPSLIHGDLWTGNVLCHDGRIAGFIDPAIYYADAEIELAFSTLFGTFGDAFFASYGERRPIKPGFFDTRRDFYNLYPLLVHVRLFGGHYVASVQRTLERFGC